jgi:outer membrane protein assembly factor BamB
VISDGKLVFVRTSHERLYAVTVADGKWKWMQSRELPTGFSIRGVASPTLDNGRVLAGFADGYLLAYNAADGAEVFKTMLEKGERFVDVDATPIVDGASIYVASYGGTLYSLSRENASIQWTYRKGGVHRAAIVGDRLFFSDADGLVHALDKKTGAEIWSFDVRDYDERRSVARGPRRQLKAPTAPVPFHDVLVLASSSGYLYALDQQNGAVRWKYWPGYGATADIVSDGGALYVHSNFGNLYRLKPSVFGAGK